MVPDWFNIDVEGLGFAFETMQEREKSLVRDKSDGFRVSSGKTKCIKKVVFEKEHCIIVDNFGNRYISKPEKGEKYDKEKGFLVALSKYNGFTTTKVHKLLENATDKDSTKSAKKDNKNKSNGNKKQSKKN